MAIVIGVGPGLGASVSRRFARAGYSVGLISRNADNFTPVLKDIAAIGGKAFGAVGDCGDETSLKNAISLIKSNLGEDVEVLVYNASGFLYGPLLKLDANELLNAFKTSAYGLLIASQLVVPSMLKLGKGTILVTGATASVRGSANFAGFAASKFSQRAIAQSLARELHPQHIHVAHVIVDGAINTPRQLAQAPGRALDTFLNSDAMADTYFHLHEQPISVWTHEIDVRPAAEKF